MVEKTKWAAKAAKKATSMAKTNEKTSLMANAKAIKELKARHLTSICAEIENLQSTNGRIPKGEISNAYEKNKPIYAWLTIDIIKKCLKKRKDKKV